MRITVRYLAQLKRLMGVDVEALEVGETSTLTDLFALLASKGNVELRRILLDDAGRPHPSLLVFVGDDQVLPSGDAPIREGTVVTLLTPMAGG